MKGYEAPMTSQRLDASLPICARIDGRSFSSFTRGCEKPFDAKISTSMRETCAYLVEETHAKIGFVQSDEISLIWQNVEGGSVIFDGKVHKMTSVLASMAAVKFYSIYGGDKLPSFDCRVWQVPSQIEAANTILWRALDARKNSVSSACHTKYSAKQMHQKNREEQVKMLAEAGVNFEEDYSSEDKWGSYYRRVTGQKEIDEETWMKIPENNKPPTRIVTRSWVDQIPMPYFGDVKNRVGVIFNGEDPFESKE